MPGITSLIETLLAATFVDKRASMLRTGKTEWALLGLAGLGACIGIFFLTLALFQSLESLYTPYIAAFISALIAFAVAATAIASREFILSKNASTYASVQDSFKENIHVVIRDICNELEEPIRENPITSVAIAALAGLLAARRI